MLKRTFDLIITGLGGIIALPLFLLIAAGIKLSSRGPVLFKQTRIGRNGRPFVLYKFRSMHVRADQDGACISVRNDPRETRIGHYLRATKVDELPQLWNVIIGDMSIVGPRPEVPQMVEHYTPEQRQVLRVRPGIVGPAQIIGRNEADMFPKDVEDPELYYIKHILPDKLKIDLEYAQEGRLMADIKLLLKGISATLSGSINLKEMKSKSVWPVLFYVDLFLMVLSYFLAYALRFEWLIPASEFHTFFITLPLVIVLRVVSFSYFQLYKTYFKYLSIRDLLRMVQAVSLSSTAIVIAVFFIGSRMHSRSIFVIDWLLLTSTMAGARVLLRLILEKPERKSYKPLKNVLIIGAGDLGETLAREFPKNGAHYRVVGFVDDNPAKTHTMIHGVRVFGNRHDIPEIVTRLRVDEILIAITNASSTDMQEIIEKCNEAKVPHRVVPAMIDLVNGKIRMSTFRKVELSDVLGRTPLMINFGAIEKAVRNKRVLITGAGGSIGSELSRQVASYNPEKLILLDRSENYLFELQEEMNYNKLGTPENTEYVIADITNVEKMDRIFAQHQPQLIFHTAAQKHVPLSENNPDEAVINNVLGTQIVAMMADRHDCKSMVLVSTDKAVHPSSVMGATKRMAELYLKSFSEYSQTRFMTVRFGNVLNSHGSVVPLFMKQIERGGPITITDPAMERFFMSIPEAVNLVLQAMVTGRSGDIYVLNMGKSVKIEQLALHMIKLAGLTPRVDIDIQYTRMRPGEKLYEELVSNIESTTPTSHAMIKRIIQVQPPIELPELQRQFAKLIKLARSGRKEELYQQMRTLVPELPEKRMLLSAPVPAEIPMDTKPNGTPRKKRLRSGVLSTIRTGEDSKKMHSKM